LRFGIRGGNDVLTLYDFGNSVCCQKVRITLCAKGLDWEPVSVDLFKGEQYDPKYLRMNPKGVVPTLVHDGKPVIESTLICEYLDKVFPEPPLVPSDPWLGSRMRVWSKMVDEGLFEGIAEISFSAMFRERMKNMPEEIRQARVKSTLEQGVRSPFVLHAIFAYEKAFKLLEETLVDGGSWIVGDSPTLADIALMPFAARLDYLGLIDVWLGDRPRVRDWWAMAKEWPSYRRGLADLITTDEITEMQAHGPKLKEDITGLLASLRDGSWHG
jgi:glutathione S-transferase